MRAKDTAEYNAAPFYVVELLIGLLISLLFDPRRLPLWVKSGIVGVTSFLIPLVFYSDPYHCSNIWPISLIFDSLQVRDPQTMSLLIGFFFTVALVGYILVCYVLSHFVSVKYRRDYKSHKYMISSACFGVMMFLLFVAFYSEASPFTDEEDEDFVKTTKRNQGQSFFTADRVGIFRQWFRIQRQAYLDNLTKDPLLYCGTWILMSGICLLCLFGIYEMRTAGNTEAEEIRKRKERKRNRRRKRAQKEAKRKKGSPGRHHDSPRGRRSAGDGASDDLTEGDMYDTVSSGSEVGGRARGSAGLVPAREQVSEAAEPEAEAEPTGTPKDTTDGEDTEDDKGATTAEEDDFDSASTSSYSSDESSWSRSPSDSDSDSDTSACSGDHSSCISSTDSSTDSSEDD